MSSRLARLAALALGVAGYGLVVAAALGLVARRAVPGAAGRVAEFPATAFPFVHGFAVWGPLLAAAAMAAFAAGLVPLVLLRGSIRHPLVAGGACGLLWLLVALAGAPYTLGLTAPAGLGLVSFFMGAFVSAGSIGASMMRGEGEGPQ